MRNYIIKNFSKVISLFLIFALALSVIPLFDIRVKAQNTIWDGSVADSFASGDGTETNPYIIKTAEELAFLAEQVSIGNEYRNTYFKLNNDIYLNDISNYKEWGTTTENQDVITPVNSWKPIGGYDYHFYGCFDGNGHSVYGVFVNENLKYGGLFGSANIIMNLGVQSSYIKAQKYAGAVAGYVSDIQNCFSDSIVLGASYNGGVAGILRKYANGCYNLGTVEEGENAFGGVFGTVSNVIIENCYNEGFVEGWGKAGGIVGNCEYSTIKNCHNSGSIDSHYKGGIVAILDNSTVLDCYNNGNLSGDNFYMCGGIAAQVTNSTISNCYNVFDFEGYGANFAGTGGIVGDLQSGTISNCYNTGDLSPTGSAYNYLGGIAGIAEKNAIIENCRNSGELHFSNSFNGVGGIVGSNKGIVRTSYNQGAVSGESSATGAGGIVGQNYSLVENCYNTSSVKNNYYYNGGICGYDENGTIRNCYNVGYIGFDSYPTSVGGIVGYAYNTTVEDSYYLNNCVSGSSNYGESLNDSQLKDSYSFNNWNFKSIWEIGNSVTYNYPTLRVFGSNKFTYNIKFYDRGNSISSTDYTNGTEIISAEPYKQDGLTFAYWETRNNGDNQRFYPGDEIIVESDCTYYAVWYVTNVSQNVWDGTYATNWEGFGTKDNPYLITNAQQFAGIEHADGYDVYFKLTEDIYLNDTNKEFNEDIIGYNLWKPLNLAYKHFDGNGKTVYGMYINDDREDIDSGLFERISSPITNLTVSDFYIKTLNAENTGGIVGYVPHDVEINNCHSINGKIYSLGNVGGIVGYAHGVSDCSNSSMITGYGECCAGGIAGYSYEPVKNCFNIGNIYLFTEDSQAGGICGYGSAEQCYNKGDIVATGDNNDIGGIVGKNINYVVSCFNIGNISATGEDNSACGIAGDSWNSKTEYCYNIGAISASSGFVRAITVNGETQYNYYIDSIVITSDEETGIALSSDEMKTVSAFVGFNFNSVWEFGYVDGYDYPTLRALGSKSYSYKITYMDGTEEINSVTYYMGTDIPLASPYINSGFDFAYWESEDGKFYYTTDELTAEKDLVLYANWSPKNISANVWDGNIDTTWQGKGTKQEPYLITNGAELAGIAQRVNNGENFANVYFKQTADIVLNDCGDEFSTNIVGKNSWTPIGDGTAYAFCGIYDGNNYSVLGMYIKVLEFSYKPFGLFGAINEATISNLTLESSYVYNQSSTNAGCLVGESNSSVIENCTNYATLYTIGWYAGTIVADSCKDNITNCVNYGIIDYAEKQHSAYTGGIVGFAASSKITGCINYANINGSYYVGGIVGYFTGSEKLQGCSNYGRVLCKYQNSSGFVAGVVGYSDSDVLDCTNSGAVTARESYSVGGVVAEHRGENPVKNCVNIGNVSGARGNIGGVVGCAEKLENCKNSGVVSVYERYNYLSLGGVVGEAEYVYNCYNTGKVEHTDVGYQTAVYDYMGGVAGVAEKVDGCYNGGIITSVNNEILVGGICGMSYEVINCYNLGSIESAVYSAGIVSRLESDGFVLNCYNNGDVKARFGSAGIACNSYGSIENCYNTGNITATGDYSKASGIVNENYGMLENCYNIGYVTGADRFGAICGYTATDSYKNCYYLSTSVSDPTYTYGITLDDAQMMLAESFIGFDFENNWEIGVSVDYEYPTLKTITHTTMFKVTFLDNDGITVLDEQMVEKGKNAVAPKVNNKIERGYVYSFDHWDGYFTDISRDTTVKAVYNQTEIIKFLDVSADITVDYGYSKDELVVTLESFFSRKLCTTTNNYKMMCEIVWEKQDINMYDCETAGTYTINGVLKITDPLYSSVSDYYQMDDFAVVCVKITVLPSDEQKEKFDINDLTYEKQGDKVVITGYNGKAENIKIPYEIEGLQVIQIADNAFAGNKYIATVNIPSSVTKIGMNAFKGCTSLINVTLNEGLLIIGDYAFADTSMICVTVPSSVEQIGGMALGSYADNKIVDGFVIYALGDSKGIDYAKRNDIKYVVVNSKTDVDSGITVVAEDNLTLAVASVKDGDYFETAMQITENARAVSVFEINLRNEKEQNVQPGNTLTVSIPVPKGFNSGNCKVYRINSDGSYRDMDAKIINGKLVFTTSHLSYYAILDVSDTPVYKGDVNGDGQTDTTDLAILKKLVAGLIDDNDLQVILSDINFDGATNTTDLAILKKIIAGLL